MSGPIIIVDYDPHWSILFEELRIPVADVLGDLASSIEHVGSTSVPGLPAKPIIDMDVVVATAAHIPNVIERLATLGYVYEGDKGIRGREAFGRRTRHATTFMSARVKALHFNATYCSATTCSNILTKRITMRA